VIIGAGSSSSYLNDPDQIQMLYVSPHRWTPYFRMAAGRQVIQTDLWKWDYKHQVLATQHMAPWRVMMWVKFIEAVMQLRPRSLRRVMAHPDLAIRDAMRWYYHIGRQVWPFEVWHFLFRDYRQKGFLTLAEFWANPKSMGAEARESKRKTTDIRVEPLRKAP
jgi:anaerobic magnesium-protoporphyrin IX monomethyl ester cyclase